MPGFHRVDLQGHRQNLGVGLQISGLPFVGAHACVFKGLRDSEKGLVIAEYVAKRAARRKVKARHRHGFVAQHRFEQGDVRGSGFTSVEPVTIENRRFRRFLAQDVKSGNTVTLELPVAAAPARALYIAAVLVALGFLGLLVMMRVVQRRSAGRSQAAVTPASIRASAYARLPIAPLHERLAQEIAALDATFARVPSPSDSVRQAYDDRRRELKSALAEAMTDALATTEPPR